MQLEFDLIAVRDAQLSDCPLLLNYWYHSPPGFIEAMGVDLKKMPKESEMEENFKSRILKNELLESSKLSALVITYDQKPIGIHSINPLFENDYGIFHAHIWDREFRGKGVGLISYQMACRVFMERFHLTKILFKTPIQNTGAIRVKEKIGIRCIGEETIGFGIIRDGTRAEVFELTKEELFRARE